MNRATEPVYSPAQVERLLKNYLAIRSVLEGSPRPAHDRVFFVDTPDPNPRERPFGYDGRPWPMNEPQRAKSVIDGKARAMAATELHVSVLDLEDGLRRLPDNDLELVYKYYLFGTHTLEDLCAERGVSSRASMLKLLQRVLRRLAKAMNNEPDA